MVCFCDIPLSQIRNHARDYGLFAIGLSKSWARKKGITPVLYVPNDSQTEISLITLFQRLQPLLAPQRNQTNLLAEEIIYLSLFVKRYEGWLERPGVPKRKVRFYDEREWRFVPPLDGRRTDDTPVVLEEAEFGNADMLRRANEAIAHKYPLSFRPEFINYVIVPEEKDILGIRDEILRIKAPFPDNDKKLLTTRILSMQHIIDDF
jgi:hypothetical protein